MSILVLADLHEGQLASATAHVVAAAQAIGGDIDVLVAGEGVQAAAEAAATLDGVSKVRVADNAVYAHQLAEPMGALLVELAGDYTHVLASASTAEKEMRSQSPNGGNAAAAGLVPLHLDPYGLYADLGHERIESLHDLLDWV